MWLKAQGPLPNIRDRWLAQESQVDIRKQVSSCLTPADSRKWLIHLGTGVLQEGDEGNTRAQQRHLLHSFRHCAYLNTRSTVRAPMRRKTKRSDLAPPRLLRSQERQWIQMNVNVLWKLTQWISPLKRWVWGRTENQKKESLTATPADSHSGSDFHPGADKDTRGYGSSSLAEVLNSLPTFCDPAACASQGAAGFLGVQSDLRQVMSPNLSLNLPQDPFRLQAPKPEADTNVRTETRLRREEEDASSAPAPSIKVQQEAKQEFWVNLRRLQHPTTGSIKPSIFSWSWEAVWAWQT